MDPSRRQLHIYFDCINTNLNHVIECWCSIFGSLSHLFVITAYLLCVGHLAQSTESMAVLDVEMAVFSGLCCITREAGILAQGHTATE